MNICIYTHTHACLSSRDVVLEHLFIQMMYVCMNIYVHTHTHMSVYQVVAWSSNTFDVCIMSCIYLYVHNMHHVMYISIFHTSHVYVPVFNFNTHYLGTCGTRKLHASTSTAVYYPVKPVVQCTQITNKKQKHQEAECTI